MPSANTKSEKISSTEASDPLRQAIVIVEHKIRNLEKRKAKLDSYKEVKDSGKILTREQNEAVSKYEEVIQQLELSREYVKQFTTICIDTEKLRKKAARKEALERTAAETAKIKQILLIQDVLQNMGTEQAREDFLAGQNGALTLTEADLKCLDDLYSEVSPKHEGPIPFATQVQKAAEHLMSIADGRSRELVGSTGAKLQALMMSIQTCGYFDQPEATVAEPDPSETQDLVPEAEETNTPTEEYVATIPPVPQEVPMAVQQTLPPNIPNSAPMHPLLQNIVPVSQVESSLFNAQGFPNPANADNGSGAAPPVVQNSVPPLNDVMARVTGNFTFFQESELEPAELGGVQPPQSSQQPLQPPAAIPSRTFTNQSFNGQPAAAPLGYPAAQTANPYFVAGYQAQGAQHYPQDMIQGYQVAGNANLAQRPAADTANRGFAPQPQHMGNAYNQQPPVPPVPAQIPATQTYQMTQPAPVEEPVLATTEEVKAEEPRQDWAGAEEPRQDWATADRLDWGSEEFAEWNPQGTDGNRSSGGSKPRGDRSDRNERPRGNYQGNRNNSNRNNYNRPGNRDRESGNNNGNYYNNQNGYQSRGGDYHRETKDREYQARGERGDRGDRADVSGGGRDGYGGQGGYRRGGALRGPRPDRQDRPERQDRSQGNSAPRNNNTGGPRPPRNNNRGSSGQNSNSFPREAQVAK